MTQIVFGVDVAKSWIDVAGPDGHRRVENTDLDSFAHRVAASGGRVVFESCGAYERPLRMALARHGAAAHRVNPSRARSLAHGLGILAKNDKLDAGVLRRMGEVVDLPETPPEPENLRHLRALHVRRRQLVAMRGDERRRLKQADDPWVRDHIAAQIAALTEEIKRLNILLARAVDADPELSAKAMLLRTAPGVGPVTTVTLLVEMTELGTLSPGAAGALTGTAPMARESGTRVGSRRIGEGRKGVRDVLFMAARSAARTDPAFAGFTQRLKQKGRAHKQATIAASRKLIVILNAMLRENRAYQAPN